jgi:outer membrane protein OmpA-like peptidoglycan-associated protein
MRVKTIALSGLLAVATLPPAHADEWLEARKGAAFAGATAAGVVLGGPLGLVGGGLLAAWMHETMDEAAESQQAKDELEITRGELVASEARLGAVSDELEAARESNAQYAQLVLDQLQLEMLFKTGEAELTNTGQVRLAALARFLAANPQIAVRLDGYADPRGDQTFNQQLSLGRVNHVARILAEYGVDHQRIERFSHGASRSVAPEGDYDAYALERAVKINLSQPGAAGIAAVD